MLDGALLMLDSSSNGPARGSYVGAMYDAGPLILWVDWYGWPSDLEIPRETTLLTGAGRSGVRKLFEILDRDGRGTDTSRPDSEVAALAMLPLAAKYVARRDDESARSMASMLGVPPSVDPLDGLFEVLSAVSGHAPIRERVRQYLDVVRLFVRDD